MKFQYGITKTTIGKKAIYVMTMNSNVAELVSAALDIINPDTQKQEDLARQIALELAREIDS